VSVAGGRVASGMRRFDESYWVASSANAAKFTVGLLRAVDVARSTHVRSQEAAVRSTNRSVKGRYVPG